MTNYVRIVALIFVATLCGCFNTVTRQSCTSDAQCGAGTRCGYFTASGATQRACVSAPVNQCATHSDCAKGYYCAQKQRYAYGASDAPSIQVYNECVPQR